MDEIHLSERTEEEEFASFRRLARTKEAKALAERAEGDFFSPRCDRAALRDACKNAEASGIGAITVSPAAVKMCVNYLGSDPHTALYAAISCPNGGDATDIKVAAVKRAVKDGVDGVEVTAPYAHIRDGNWLYLRKECKKLKKTVKIRTLRIACDCSLLSEKEVTKLCFVAADAGVNCIRLDGADRELFSAVKSALKGRCLLKYSVAESLSDFELFSNMGADAVCCKSAFDVAEQVIKQAEES